MTPFPEAEIMTIKRLEVALRKMDYKLLKDGAYKLHEKFHGGYKFEYLNLLEEILLEVSENPQVPSDIKDILCPTIEDILLQSDYSAKSKTDIALEQAKERVFEDNKNLESEEEKAAKMSAFDAFGSQRGQNQQQPTRFFTQSPFSAQPFKDFNPSGNANQVHSEPTPLFFENQVKYEQRQETAQNEYSNVEIQNHEEITNNEIEKTPENVVNSATEQQVAQTSFEEVKIDVQQPQYNEIVAQSLEQQVFEEEKNEVAEVEIEQNVQETENEIIEEKEPEKKTVAIFYGQDYSIDKIKNINEYRRLLRDKTSPISSVLKLISEISIQANTNVVELRGVLEKLKANQNKISLITNSQSAMFFELFNSLGIEYDLNDVEFESDINLSALYGLSNLFVCDECEEKYVDTQVGLKPLIIECPKCKQPMLPEFYAQSEGVEINMEYYNSAFVSLANSKVWLLIHPSFNDKVSSDLIESAFRVSKTVEEVYILDKDINVRETYKYIFSKINPDVKIDVQSSALEDFLNSI